MQRDGVRRRTLLAAFPALAVAPRALAQSKRVRLALVSPANSVDRMNMASGGLYAGLLGELRRLGYAEGETLAVERHSAEGHPERLPGIAQAVVASAPDCIFAQSSEAAIPLKAATSTIPIVTYANSPVDHGLIATLARPGGNVTGFAASPGVEFLGKRLQYLHEAAPKAVRIGFLSPRADWEQVLAPAVEQIRPPGLELLGAAEGGLGREQEYRRFFAAMAAARMQAVVVSDTADNARNVEVIQTQVQKARLPAIYPWRFALRAGGLMSYGVDTLASGTGLGDYIARIFKGARPADLPYQQPSKFELVLNLVAARQIGLRFPRSLLARADETLE